MNNGPGFFFEIAEIVVAEIAVTLKQNTHQKS